MLAKRIALGFGIAIIFPMMVHYGVRTFAPKPKWQDYRVQINYNYSNLSPEEKAKYDSDKERLNKEYRAKQKEFEKVLFAVAVPLGIAAIIIGSLLPIQAIGTGLMFGGIFNICNGYVNYWSELNDVLRFLSLLLAFIVLLVIGYKKLEKKQT
ncbi:MAG: hypothetical protein PHU64_07035 [Candidatus Omnitrophica bacterium]|nr:hypothetical protein [Candidatus Omnitrophota bacterium]MDD5430207.1 hypothetical protein [Candidatus Omnitrophota bacterium]